MDVFCSVVVYVEQETARIEPDWTLSISGSGAKRKGVSLSLPLRFSSFQRPHKGQGRSLKSTGPPRPASASSRDMITAMAASSLLGLLDPGSSMMSMLRWELSPGWKMKCWEKGGKRPNQTIQQDSAFSVSLCATHSWWTGWSRGSLQNQVQEWSQCSAARVSLHSESIRVIHKHTDQVTEHRSVSAWAVSILSSNIFVTLRCMGRTCQRHMCMHQVLLSNNQHLSPCRWFEDDNQITILLIIIDFPKGFSHNRLWKPDVLTLCLLYELKKQDIV